MKMRQKMIVLAMIAALAAFAPGVIVHVPWGAAAVAILAVLWAVSLMTNKTIRQLGWTAVTLGAALFLTGVSLKVQVAWPKSWAASTVAPDVITTATFTGSGVEFRDANGINVMNLSMPPGNAVNFNFTPATFAEIETAAKYDAQGQDVTAWLAGNFGEFAKDNGTPFTLAPALTSAWTAQAGSGAVQGFVAAINQGNAEVGFSGYASPSQTAKPQPTVTPPPASVAEAPVQTTTPQVPPVAQLLPKVQAATNGYATSADPQPQPVPSTGATFSDGKVSPAPTQQVEPNKPVPQSDYVAAASGQTAVTKHDQVPVKHAYEALPPGGVHPAKASNSHRRTVAEVIGVLAAAALLVLGGRKLIRRIER